MRVRVRRWAEGNDVHATVSIGLAVLVEFGVEVEGRRVQGVRENRIANT